MAPIRPSIMSLGATMSAPAAACETAVFASSSTVSSFKTWKCSPSRRVTPQWPWLMYSQRQTSVITSSSGNRFFDRAHRLLDDAVFRVGAARLFIFLRRNAEEQHRLQSRGRRRAALRRPRLPSESWKTPGMLAIGRGSSHLFADEKRQDEIVRGQPRFAHQISQRWRCAQATGTMNQFPHRPRLSARLQASQA